MPTVAELAAILTPYAGQGNTFLDRFNLYRSRIIQRGNWKGCKQEMTLQVYSDRWGYSIVTLPHDGEAILAGAVVRGDVSSPVGRNWEIRNAIQQFSRSGRGYGAQWRDFQEQTSRYSVFQEWTSPMRLRFKFETTESAGVIHVRGMRDGEKVYSLYSGTWTEGEKFAYSGSTTVTGAKYFDPDLLSVIKPVTNGRVTMYVVDDDGNETLVGTYEPKETVVRRKRYRIPKVQDITAVTPTTPPAAVQFYTKAELDSMFADAGTITVSADGTHDLVYTAYFARIVRVVAQAGSYTHNFLLDNSAVKNGGTLRIKLEVEEGAQVLNFYDNAADGTLLQTVSADPDNAIYETLVFSFDGANWHFEGREV